MRFPLKRSLRTELIGFSLALMLVPSLTGGFLAYRSAEQAMEEKAGNLLHGSSAPKEQALRSWFAEQMEELEIHAASHHFQQHFTTLLATEDKHVSKSHIRSVLQQVVKNGDDFLELFLMDLDGRIQVSSTPGQERKLRADRPYFQKGRLGMHLQSVYHSLTLNAPAMTIATPIRRPDGIVLGVLAGRLNLVTLEQITHEFAGLGVTGDSYLVSRYNYFVTNPRHSPDVAFQQAVFTEGVSRCLAELGQGLAEYLDYRGVPVLGTYVWIPEPELCMVTEMESQEAFRFVQEFRTLMLVLLVCVISIALLGAALMSQRFTAPIRKLVQLSRKLAEGQFGEQMTASNLMEVQSLSQAFNDMANSLETYNRFLEEKVELRTQELEEKNTELEKTMQELDDARSQQLTQAYQAGMMENSVSVLHNIGNAITPLGVRVAQASEDQTHGQLVNYLREMSKLLNTHLQQGSLESFLISDSKGQQVLPFLEKLVEQIGQFDDKSTELLNTLQRHLHHIAEIISLQQKYANMEGIEEEYRIERVLEDVMELMQPTLDKRKIEVQREISENLQALYGDPNKLAQSLLNLVKNAVESIDARTNHERTQGNGASYSGTLGLHLQPDADEGIALHIADNGMGCAPETLEQVFRFGFSTKNRSSGFGLHDCANFIRNNGGDITLDSPGVYQGATVRLTLKYRQPRRTALSSAHSESLHSPN